ncbi:hypothetical protein V8C86DRAFT_2629401 [Haematococcus lacustris]
MRGRQGWRGLRAWPPGPWLQCLGLSACWTKMAVLPGALAPPCLGQWPAWRLQGRLQGRLDEALVGQRLPEG